MDFETVVLPVPQFDPEHPQMISQGPSVCVFHKDDPQVVLASWLFAQYLISNEVQIPYAETEGYVPVTSKAQQSAEYQDYLARAGEDNDTHYDIKIAASELLMAHTADTFVTPVFNGSTSLRNASGYMIEDVVKSARRKRTVDDAYIKELYGVTASRYNLTEDSGPLPQTAVVLLASLAAAWVLIIAYFLYTQAKKKKA